MGASCRPRAGVYEDMNANVIVVGEYKAFNKDHTDRMETVDVRVRVPLRA